MGGIGEKTNGWAQLRLHSHIHLRIIHKSINGLLPSLEACLKWPAIEIGCGLLDEGQLSIIIIIIIFKIF